MKVELQKFNNEVLVPLVNCLTKAEQAKVKDASAFKQQASEAIFGAREKLPTSAFQD